MAYGTRYLKMGAASRARQHVRRRLLHRAHGTTLWASYRPEVPRWATAAALPGVALILSAIAPGRGAARGARLVAGLLLCAPLAILSEVVRRGRTRRDEVRGRVLNAVDWRGDERVLDVGCGSGMLLNGAAARLSTGQAVGIDIWAEHAGGGDLKLLLKHARAEGVVDRIRFDEVDARRMPYEDASFDVVLSSWALHHISHGREDFDAAVGEMLRVLRPGGTIVVADTAHMVEVLADRMRGAGLEVDLQDAPRGQKIVVAHKAP